MKPRSIRITPTEQDECITFVDWTKTIKVKNQQVVYLYDCIFHFANESKRSDFDRIMMARIGTKKGVSDYIITVPVSEYHGLFIEMKKRRGSAKPSKEQIEFIQRMKEMGYWGVFAYGAEDAIDHTINYLGDLIVGKKRNVLPHYAQRQESQIII